MAITEATAERTLRQRQFSLGGLLATVTIIAVALGWLVDRNQLTRRLAAVESSINAKVQQRTRELQHRLQVQERLHIVAPMGKIGVEALLRKNIDVYAEVTTVSFHDKQLTDGDLGILSQFPSVRCIHLRGSQFSDAAVAQAAARLPKLQRAWLGGAWITDKTIAILAGVKGLDGLGLDESNVSDDGLEQLAALPELNTLTLIGAPITDQSLRHLTTLPKLRELHLERTQVSDAGLSELANMPALRVLSVEGTKVTSAGQADLQSRLPQCLILP